MKQKISLLILFLVILGICGCGNKEEEKKIEDSLLGKYILYENFIGDRKTLELHDNNRCYYDFYKSYDCEYYKNGNKIIIQYKFYDLLNERHASETETFEIVGDNLEGWDGTYYKQ